MTAQTEPQADAQEAELRLSVFIKTSAMVVSLTQAAHAHMLGEIASPKGLALLLLGSVSHQLDRLAREAPADVADVYGLMQCMVEDYDAKIDDAEDAS